MKTYCIAAAALLASAPAFAQMDSVTAFNTDNEKGLIQSISKIEKKTDAFNLYFNMHGNFKADWNGSHFNEGKFQMQQFRIEAKGRIAPWVSYRYRQRVNKGDDPKGYRDNLWNSIDLAEIMLNFGKWDIALGKQCAAYGGIEFDLNPIEIYQYSDMVDYMTNFMSGVTVGYNFTGRQQLQFQILNAYNTTSRAMYGDYEKSKLPMVYTLNWNGNFSDVYKTRWSASVMSETKGAQMYYFALGNDFKISDKVGAYFDWMYSREGVDRKGIMTSIVGGTDPLKNTAKAEYMSFILHFNYRFLPDWNIFCKLMYENEGIYKTHKAQYDGEERDIRAGKYRTALGYIGGVEYYPFKDRNLHFYATYIGRDYLYTAKAKSFGMENYTTNCLQIGFIWQMPVF